MARYCPEKNGPALYPDCAECDRTCEAFFCLVVGSRSITDYEWVKSELDRKLHGRVVIVSGGAKGVDSLAERYAKEKGYELRVFKADWDKYGKSAGYIRNEEMHAYLARHKKRGVMAFWDGKSKGTAHNFDLAKKYKNPINIKVKKNG